MKRSTLFPVVALSAMTLALAACDNNAPQQTDETAAVPPATEQAMTPESAMMPPAAEQAPAAAPAPMTEIQGGMMVQNAYAFATAAGSTTGAVFAVLHNASSVEDALVGATTDVAEKVELHESKVDATTGVMNMSIVERITIPAQGKVEMTPNGFHVMLINLKSPLEMGQTFNISFQFASGASINVPVTISAAGAAQPMAHDHGVMGHDHGTMHDDATVAPSMPTEAMPATPADPSMGVSEMPTPIMPDAAMPAAPTVVTPTPAVPMPAPVVAPTPAPSTPAMPAPTPNAPATGQ